MHHVRAASEGRGADLLGLPPHGLGLLDRGVDQTALDRLWHGLHHDEVAQPLQEVGGEPARVVPGLHHPVHHPEDPGTVRRGPSPAAFASSWKFGAALYLATITYLLRYVFQPEVMTADKLYGAAAAYLMIGVLWAYLYSILDHAYPQSFSVAGQPTTLQYTDAFYFSFTVLTSTGFGDVVPLTRQARAVCVVEQLTGAMFLAILIARLAGVYPPLPRKQP